MGFPTQELTMNRDSTPPTVITAGNSFVRNTSTTEREGPGGWRTARVTDVKDQIQTPRACYNRRPTPLLFDKQPKPSTHKTQLTSETIPSYGAQAARYTKRGSPNR